MFWTQAAGVTQLGSARPAATNETTAPTTEPKITIARRRTRIRRITRTQDHRGGHLLVAPRLLDYRRGDLALSVAASHG